MDTLNSQEGKSRALISIVIPARNEEENIRRLEAELHDVVKLLPYQFEFIVIDNASSDRTGQLVRDVCRRDPRWRYLRLSRDFTVEMSLTAGYRLAKGEAIIVLYSDLQDPPKVIPRLIEKWREGYDVVYGVRTRRLGEPRWRNAAVKVAYRMISWLAEVQIPENTGDFRLVTRRVCDALNGLNETNRYLRGMIAWLGFRQIGVEYERLPRTCGVSKAPFWELLLYTINAITSFSLRPLRVFSVLGIVIVIASLLAMAVYAILWMVGSPPPGITTLIILGLGATGLNSLGVGVLGEYVGRIYAEVKRRPLYVTEQEFSLPCGNGVSPAAEEIAKSTL